MKSDKAGGVNVSFSSVCHVVLGFCGSVVLGSSQPPAHAAENIRRENVETKQET